MRRRRLWRGWGVDRDGKLVWRKNRYHEKHQPRRFVKREEIRIRYNENEFFSISSIQKYQAMKMEDLPLTLGPSLSAV